MNVAEGSYGIRDDLLSATSRTILARKQEACATLGAQRTIGLPSPMRSLNVSMNPYSTQNIY